jgi:hypothetical protein
MIPVRRSEGKRSLVFRRRENQKDTDRLHSSLMDVHNNFYRRVASSAGSPGGAAGNLSARGQL